MHPRMESLHPDGHRLRWVLRIYSTVAAKEMHACPPIGRAHQRLIRDLATQAFMCTIQMQEKITANICKLNSLLRLCAMENISLSFILNFRPIQNIASIA